MIRLSATPPSEPRPEVAPALQTHIPPALMPLEEIPLVKPVPQAKYGSVNLKKYSSFKIERTNIKLSNQEALAIQQLEAWLSSIDPALNHYNIELLIDVMNFLQSFFIYGGPKEREASIDRVLKKCMLPYFKNDPVLIDVVIESNKHRIIRSTKLSRRLSKVKVFFCTVMEVLLSSRSSSSL